MELRSILSLLALLAGAVASGVLLFTTREDETAAPEEPRLGVGYYVSDARLTGTADDGSVLYRMTAASVIQAPADGSVNLQQVSVDYDPATEMPWDLSADSGRIPAGGKMIELTGNVVAATRNAENDANSPAATIRTDYLEFDPATDIAATDRNVVIEYAGSTVHATGMRALLREDRLELLGNVTGQYVR